MHGRIACAMLALYGCASTHGTVQSGSVASFDGLPIAYDVAGRGEPALIFVHGWCCNRGHWSEQMKAFAPDHRVVAIDLGGHGASGRTRESWRMQDYPRDVEAVVRHLGLERVLLVGHSMGGPVCLMAAARMPDRVVGVIGVDTLQRADLVYTEETIAPFVTALENDFAGGSKRFVGSAFPPDADPALVDRVTRAMSGADPRMAIGLMRSYVGFDPREALAACPVPVRCINTTLFMQTDVEGNRRYAPGFDAVVLEGLGHFPMLEDPARFDAALRGLVAELSRR
jgi:sigma-B regulation protein RsbQ